MDYGAILSYALLFAAMYFFIYNFIGILHLFLRVLVLCLLHKEHPPYNATASIWAMVISGFYIVLFCTGHVKF